MAQFQNGQRQVINTIEDTSKYQTGDARRLRVHSDPLSIQASSKQSGLGQLAEALGTIKPALMNWGVEKQTSIYEGQIESGKTKAQTGGKAQGEMEQYGYDNVKAVNDWTDWNQKVLQDYDQTFDKENGNLEEFLKAQWEAHPFQDKGDTYTAKFTALAGKSLEKIREAQGKFNTDLQETKNTTELTRTFYHDIKDVQGSGMDYTTGHYEARRENLKAQFPGKTNSQLDVIAFEAVNNTVEETGDTSLFDVFKNPHLDGTPGLYEVPAWRDKITAITHKVLESKHKALREHDVEIEKQLKDAANTMERGLLFKMIDINTFADPTVRADKLRELVVETEVASSSGIPISDTTIKLLMTASTGIDKKEETLYQAQNYNKLRLGSPTVAQIARAINNGDISQGGFEKLMNAKDAAANRAASSQGKEKPLTSDPFVKQMSKDIKAHAGYSWGSMSPSNEQARQNANAVEARVLDYVEGLVESGASVKEAASKGSEMGIKLLEQAGLASKTLSDANDKLDAVERKKKNPVAYYTSDINLYTEDVKNNTVPSGITPKDKLMLQKKAAEASKSKKRINSHESTK